MASQAVLDLLVRLTDNASKGMASIGDAAGKLGLVAGGVAVAGVVALGAAVVAGVGDAREAAKLYAQTEAVLKSTGGAAGVTAEQVTDLATALSAASGASLFGDSQIQESTNLLLTFTNIKKGALDAATAMSVDMAQALGGAPKDAAIQLGKALNDPIKGISALSRVGVTFTEEQKEQIKTMQEAGDMAGAQAVILAELNKEFGGSAAAAAAADGGWAQFNDRMGEAGEQVGAALLPLLGMLSGFLLDTIVPAVETAAAAFSAWLSDPTVQANIAALGEAISTGLGVAFAFISDTAIPALLSAWAFIQPAIDAVLPLFTGEMPAALGQTGETFVLLGGIVTTAMALIQSIISQVLPAIVAFWNDHGAQIMAIVKADFDFIVSVINAALILIQGIIKIALDLINGDWSKAWADLQAMSASFVQAIGNVISSFLELIASYFNTSLSGIVQTWTDNWNMLVNIATQTDWAAVGQSVVDGILSGLASNWNSLTSWVSDKIGSLVDSALDAIGAGSPARQWMPVGQFSIMGIIAGFEQTMPDLRRGVEDLGRGMIAQAKNIANVAQWAPVGEFSVTGILQGFQDMWPSLMAEVSLLGDDLVDHAMDIAAAAQKALSGAFGSQESMDRQIASNLDKLKDVLPQYLAFTQGALAQAQKEAEGMLDPAQGAKWLKLRSDQILEYASLQKQLNEAATKEDRDRIQAQMALINQAQQAAIKAFQATQVGATSPYQSLIDQIGKLFNNPEKQKLEEELSKAKTQEERDRILQLLKAAALPVNDTGIGATLMALLKQLEQMFGLVPKLAGGGPVGANQPYWVGERGPELFVPRSAGAIVPNGAGAAGMTINNTFVLPPGTPAQLVDMVMEKLNRQVKGRR